LHSDCAASIKRITNSGCFHAGTEAKLGVAQRRGSKSAQTRKPDRPKPIFENNFKKEKSSMKKTVSILLAIVMVLSLLAACGGTQQGSTPAAADSQPAAA